MFGPEQGGRIVEGHPGWCVPVSPGVGGCAAGAFGAEQEIVHGDPAAFVVGEPGAGAEFGECFEVGGGNAEFLFDFAFCGVFDGFAGINAAFGDDEAFEITFSGEGDHDPAVHESGDKAAGGDAVGHAGRPGVPGFIDGAFSALVDVMIVMIVMIVMGGDHHADDNAMLRGV